jgi:hypothetical protein
MVGVYCVTVNSAIVSQHKLMAVINRSPLSSTSLPSTR